MLKPTSVLALVSDFQLFARFFLLVVATYDTRKPGCRNSRAPRNFHWQEWQDVQAHPKAGYGTRGKSCRYPKNHAVKVRNLPMTFADNSRAIALESVLDCPKAQR